jgi:hypothetical protein
MYKLYVHLNAPIEQDNIAFKDSGVNVEFLQTMHVRGSVPP